MESTDRAENTILTPDDIAKRWRVSSVLVIDMLNSGELTGYKVRKQYRVPMDVVEEYEKTNKLPKEPK